MATKKATKKPAASPRGNTYTLTATGKKHLADVSGQGALIRDTIAKHQPITAAEVSTRLPKVPKPNIAFYLSVWKGDGFVKFGTKKSK